MGNRFRVKMRRVHHPERIPDPRFILGVLGICLGNMAVGTFDGGGAHGALDAAWPWMLAVAAALMMWTAVNLGSRLARSASGSAICVATVSRSLSLGLAALYHQETWAKARIGIGAYGIIAVLSLPTWKLWINVFGRFVHDLQELEKEGAGAVDADRSPRRVP